MENCCYLPRTGIIYHDRSVSFHFSTPSVGHFMMISLGIERLSYLLFDVSICISLPEIGAAFNHKYILKTRERGVVDVSTILWY